MQKLKIEPPVVQVAIDVLSIDAALRIAEAAVRAGVDWLEVGTPLVTFVGVSAIGALAQAFPGVPVLADYKIMDGARKYVVEAGRQGGRIATVCAQASDATVRAAIQAGEEAGVAVISDLYNAPDVAQRAAEIAAFGIDSVYVHWGADQRTEWPERDPLLDLPAVLARVTIPVGVERSASRMACARLPWGRISGWWACRSSRLPMWRAPCGAMSNRGKQPIGGEPVNRRLFGEARIRCWGFFRSRRGVLWSRRSCRGGRRFCPSETGRGCTSCGWACPDSRAHGPS
jgi:3-hexulose-6-phosphate synthase/6-phospho-3-hexuloisomerase